jgi:hypothetical protein
VNSEEELILLGERKKPATQSVPYLVEMDLV